MKKTHYLFAAICAVIMLTGLSSCKKDGVYNPGKKISKIYFEGNSGKMISEYWHWDGGKLAQIDYYSSGRLSSSDFLNYDGKQLVEYLSGNTRSVLNYDGSKLNTVETYNGGDLDERITVSARDGKKITQLSIELFNQGKSGNDEDIIHRNSALLRLLVSPSLGESAKENLKTALKMRDGSKATYILTVELTYDGSNATSETWKYPDGSSATYQYTYDDKNNPLCNFYNPDAYGFNYSSNNILTIIYTTSGGTSSNSSRTYQYDGKWPVEYSYVYSGSTYRIYYEYK